MSRFELIVDCRPTQCTNGRRNTVQYDYVVYCKPLLSIIFGSTF